MFAGERCAIVLNNEVEYGMARLHAVLIDPLDVDLREEDLVPGKPADASAR